MPAALCCSDDPSTSSHPPRLASPAPPPQPPNCSSYVRARAVLLVLCMLIIRRKFSSTFRNSSRRDIYITIISRTSDHIESLIFLTRFSPEKFHPKSFFLMTSAQHFLCALWNIHATIMNGCSLKSNCIRAHGVTLGSGELLWYNVTVVVPLWHQYARNIPAPNTRYPLIGGNICKRCFLLFWASHPLSETAHVPSSVARQMDMSTNILLYCYMGDGQLSIAQHHTAWTGATPPTRFENSLTYYSNVTWPAGGGVVTPFDVSQPQNADWKYCIS